MGAPRGCPGAPCARLLRGRQGRTKAAAARGPLWGCVGRRRFPGSGAEASVPRSVLRYLVLGAAPLLRAVGPVARPGQHLSSRRERYT